ncbi:MAG: hypothetical protein CSA81_06550 [Acidobacteria bacterium]|nr:MAG: hypothetical protein CSA81_06550 [Acidobacteriota bacterium]
MGMMFLFLSAIWVAWIILGACFQHQSHQRLTRIPHRILVSGGRGKTTLVRLVHAALTASDCPTVGRVTGDKPLLIGPDGREHAVRRLGPANIRELRKMLTFASKARALVVENMAIQPELQATVARKLVCPNLVLMAPDVQDHLELFPADQKKRMETILEAHDPDIPLILPRDHSEKNYALCADALGFSWHTYSGPAINSLRPFMQTLVEMALTAVERTCGQVSANAKSAILRLAGELQGIRVFRRNTTVWIDGFSVNDPLSAEQFIHTASGEALKRGYTREARLFNHRSDRPSRLPLFEKLLPSSGPVWVIGEPIPLRWKARFKMKRIKGSPREIVASVESQLPNTSQPHLVYCLGNTAGAGHALRDWLGLHAEVETW